MSELIRLLSFRIGVDPAGIPVLIDKNYYIQSGAAEYVQTIHMTWLEGVLYIIADDGISIISSMENITQTMKNTNCMVKKIISLAGRYFAFKHEQTEEIFFAICTQRIYLYADIKGKGKGLVSMVYPQNDLPKCNANQIMVGNYRARDTNQKKKAFELNFVGNEMKLQGIVDFIWELSKESV